jgi:predicted transglutaminase-like cysteine proteinase
VAYAPDPAKYDRDDWWEDALDESNQGDCEDYAIAKLRKLLAGDWPRGDLKLGLCYVETGEYHCVLVATCAGEDWVLDNRVPHITRWQDVPYRWDRFYLLSERVWRAAA